MKKTALLLLVLFTVCRGFADVTWSFNTDGDYEGWVDYSDRLIDSVSSGVLSYSYNEIADPQLRQNTGLSSVDLSRNFTVEMKIRRTSGSSLAYIWAYVDPSTSGDHVFANYLMEDNNDWQVVTFNYTGGRDTGTMDALRIDPIQGVEGDAGSTWEIDYIKIIQEEPPANKLTWNFDTDDDYEWWVDSGNRLVDSVAGGVLTFQYNDVADPQLRQSEGLTAVDLARDFTLEIKIRRTAGSSLAFIWGYVDPSTAADHAFANYTLADNNDWQVVSLNYTGGRDTGTMDALRIDPIQGTSADAGSTWEIDYIKLIQEPSITSNGVPATWMIDNGVLSDYDSAELTDLDGDSFLMWEEYYLGTDPNDAASCFTASMDGTDLTWIATTNSGVTLPFEVYRSTDLSGWTRVASNVTRSATGVTVWSDPSPPAENTGVFYYPALPIP